MHPEISLCLLFILLTPFTFATHSIDGLTLLTHLKIPITLKMSIVVCQDRKDRKD
jgi:hypothetical protein